MEKNKIYGVFTLSKTGWSNVVCYLKKEIAEIWKDLNENYYIYTKVIEIEDPNIDLKSIIKQKNFVDEFELLFFGLRPFKNIDWDISEIKKSHLNFFVDYFNSIGGLPLFDFEESKEDKWVTIEALINGKIFWDITVEEKDVEIVKANLNSDKVFKRRIQNIQ